MTDLDSTLALWDYRRRVADIYRAARRGGAGAETWWIWRNARDALFASHPQSAVEPDARDDFPGLNYFEYDPAWRFEAEVEPQPPDQVELAHSEEGTTGFRRFGRVRILIDGRPVTLPLYWLSGYGGGVFLPFRDTTSGMETYGGGRYLLDTAKGADLGHRGRIVVLDFNYAYHPSCVHSSRWSCPLAPPANHLDVAVRAGEKLTPGLVE